MKYFNSERISIMFLIFYSCNNTKAFDASGNFESDEVIVSAQQNGQLLSFNLDEGDTLTTGEMVGQIDTTVPTLQMQQALATIQSLKSKTSNVQETNDLVEKQLAVLQVELDHMIHEKDRTAKPGKSRCSHTKTTGRSDGTGYSTGKTNECNQTAVESKFHQYKYNQQQHPERKSATGENRCPIPGTDQQRPGDQSYHVVSCCRNMPWREKWP